MASSSSKSSGATQAVSLKSKLVPLLVSDLLDLAIYSFGCQSGLRSNHKVRGDPVLEGVSWTNAVNFEGLGRPLIAMWGEWTRSFRLMSCSPGFVSLGLKVDSLGVWSHVARGLKISLFLLVFRINRITASSRYSSDRCNDEYNRNKQAKKVCEYSLF